MAMEGIENPSMNFNIIKTLDRGSGWCTLEVENGNNNSKYNLKLACIDDFIQPYVEDNLEKLTKCHHQNVINYYNKGFFKTMSSTWLENEDIKQLIYKPLIMYPHLATGRLLYAYAIMEANNDMSLRRWLRENTIEQRPNDIYSIFHQLIRAVHYIHSKKLEHNYLKPSNIFVSQNAQIKIGSFGLPYEHRPLFKATDCYNPDIMYGRNDIRSLGLIFFELLLDGVDDSERKSALDNVISHRYPEGFVSKYIKEYLLIERMVLSSSPSLEDLHSQLDNIPRELNKNENNLQSNFNEVEILDNGTSWVLFKARRKCVDRQCFVKVNTLPDSSRDMWTSMDCDHPNILKYNHSLAEEPFRFPLKNSPNLYIFSDFHDQTLRDWLVKNNSVKQRADYIISIFDQIVKSVKYIHTNGLIHRNLKAKNIFISKETKKELELKIGLFGFANEDNEIDIYKAPEQGSNSNYDKKVDIFSLGLIIYEIINCESKEKLFNTLRSFKLGKYCLKEFAKDYPIGCPLLEKMLSHKPDDRPTADELYSQLSKILEDYYDNIYADKTSHFEKSFSIIESLGGGSYGHVFLVKNEVDDKQYAVKRVFLRQRSDQKEFSKDVEKSKEEVKNLAKLKHKNIVEYKHNAWIERMPAAWRKKNDENLKNRHDRNKISSMIVTSNVVSPPNMHNSVEPVTEVYLYIQMEYCNGGSLENWLREDTNKERIGHTRNFFLQMTDAVEYMHSKNVIHGDLHTANIFISQKGEEEPQIKIGDFGLAYKRKGTGEISSSTSSAAVHTSYVGKKNYTASEVTDDIYSLGLIFYKLLKYLGFNMGDLESLDGKYPKQFSEEGSREYLLETMLSKLPEKRPNASRLKKTVQEMLDSHKI
uniref:non-specific serine/threonine protein kinase n=1 Tax=Glossina brevipalpis TaxID=37001 RepID=A0A1A9WNU6_9MUSC